MAIVTIKMLDLFGNPVERKGTIVGEVTHGYNLKSGAWGLYPDKDGSSVPAVFIGFRPYRKKRIVAINKNRIVE